MRRPAFDHPPLVHHHDAIKIQNRIDFVRDRDERVTREGRAQKALNMSICASIEAVGCN